MNKIIIIGNGFDLAHGMPTRYKDFINSYWIGVVEELKKIADYMQVDPYCNTYSDDFIKVELSRVAASVLRYVLNDLKEEYSSYIEIRDKLFNRIQGDFRHCISMIHELKLVFKNTFFQQITNLSCQNWVDIENEYYRSLCECLEKKNRGEDRINKEFLAVKSHLIKYLQECEKKFVKTFEPNMEIREKLLSPLKERDISIKQSHLVIAEPPRGIMLVNFNYTSVADIYLHDFNQCNINHIHGKLGEKEDKIIFGYGDELDSKYKAIEECNDNRYLENIKTVCYLKSPNYRRLLEFSESSYFQVVIMGHSCGNSDRTLLNTLFEHKYCVSIKPFYHQKEDGTDDYDDIVCNIYRNFRNKQLMRDRVVNKTFCEPLPQNIKRQ